MMEKEIPAVPLSLDTLCLAIGDDRFFYPLGGDTHDTQPQQNAKALPHDESRGEPAPARISDDASGEATPDPAYDAQDGGDQRTVIVDELARWRERALEDVRVGHDRVFRGFTTTVIPESIHTSISNALQWCRDEDDVVQVFASYVNPMPDEPLEEHAYPHDKIVLQQHIHELFNGVAERGHKALSEGGES